MIGVSSRAGTPGGQQLREIGCTDRPIAVQVGRTAGIVSPGGQQNRQIARTHRTIPIKEVAKEDTDVKRTVNATDYAAGKQCMEFLANVGSEGPPRCKICLQEFIGSAYANGIDIKGLRCKHEFHTDCFNKWQENLVNFNVDLNSCPVCDFVA